MQHRIELAHLVLEVPDPASLDMTFGQVVGLVPGDPTPTGGSTWRNDDHAQRIVVEAGDRNDAVAIGFEVVAADAFDELAERIGAVEDAELAAARRVGRLARAAAPFGVDVELVLDPARAAAPFVSPLVPGGFLTEGVGFGHVVFATTAFEASLDFLVDGLGFTRSDWLDMEVAPGIALEVQFLHCNPRHHTVALARAPFELPQALHHVMVEMHERDDVGAAFDRLWATDLAVPNGLGRHPNDGMFSFYLQTPAGFQVEVGTGARVIHDGWDDDRAYAAISAWGHQPLRP